jgi:methyltransferase OMS1
MSVVRRFALPTVVAFVSGIAATSLILKGSSSLNKNKQRNPSSVEIGSDDADGNQWHRLAATYDAKIDAEERQMDLATIRESFLCANLRGDVLEVAAGTGRNLPFLLRKSADIKQLVLADSSSKMVDQMRRKLAAAVTDVPLAVELRVADAQALPFSDASFDFVLSSFSLCSVDLPLSSLAEMARVLRPDGEIRLLEHGRSSWFVPLNWYLDRMAHTHYQNWGCMFNRDIERFVKDSASSLRVVSHTTKHLGTTHMYILKKR